MKLNSLGWISKCIPVYAYKCDSGQVTTAFSNNFGLPYKHLDFARTAPEQKKCCENQAKVRQM